MTGVWVLLTPEFRTVMTLCSIAGGLAVSILVRWTLLAAVRRVAK
ncbi:MAG: hypothetical protein Q8Q29_03660 [Actinomycetota bacterium]|nr:hypothetical protein [Actinomycetota bacterium]